MQGKQISEYQRKRILFLRDKGMTNKKIADELGLAVATVSEITRKNGQGQDHLRKNVRKVKSLPYRQFTEYCSHEHEIKIWFNHNEAKGIPCAIEKINKKKPGTPDRYAVWVVGEKAGANGSIKNTAKIRGQIVEEAHDFKKVVGL